MLLRRLRGIAASALVWGAAWAFLGASALVGINLVSGVQSPRPEIGPSYLLGLFGIGFVFFGKVGAMSGALFAAAVAFGERHRTFASLRTGRMLLWGALGGAAMPWVVSLGFLGAGTGEATRLLVIGGIGAVLGAGSAWAVLGLARRAREPQATQELASGVEWSTGAPAREHEPVRPGAT